MTITDIRELPAVLRFSNDSPGSKGVHESCFRVYAIMQKVKELLGKGVPASVILELIAEMEGKS